MFDVITDLQPLTRFLVLPPHLKEGLTGFSPFTIADGPVVFFDTLNDGVDWSPHVFHPFTHAMLINDAFFTIKSFSHGDVGIVKEESPVWSILHLYWLLF